MLELVSNGKYWIDALHDKVISLLKGIFTLGEGTFHTYPQQKKTLLSAQASQKMVKWEMSQFA
jgi:hypothetical protein